jgi:hypothetical protein
MLTREQILAAFSVLDEKLGQRDAQAEIAIIGGAVMVLAYRARLTTKDVDAIFSPTAIVREVAAEVGAELGLPEGWLNDGAKGWLSPHAEFVEADLPRFKSLRITYPTPEYLLAMKVLAARTKSEGDHGDRPDIATLCRHLHLRDVRTVMDIVVRYYPAEWIGPRSEFLVEEVLAEIRVADPKE